MTTTDFLAFGRQLAALADLAAAKALLNYTKSDIGLSNVDNTSDVNKPISNAQATKNTSLDNDIAAKIPKSDIVDALNSTDATKVLSAKQGKALSDMILSNNAIITKYSYAVAQGQTTITGADKAGKSLVYTPGVPFLITKDGFDIEIGDDYTATTGTSIVLTTAAEQACDISIVVFGSFAAANHYTKAESDARYDTKSQVDGKITALGLKSASKADILGAVSQTAGVPTGAIIEAGSNALGAWTKYADGRMICEFRRTRNTAVNTALGSIFYNGGPTANNYPQAFISIPWTGITVEGAGVWSAYVSPATATAWPSYYLQSAVARVATDINEHFIAIGRWF